MYTRAYAFGGLGLTLRAPAPMDEPPMLRPFARQVPPPGWTVECSFGEDLPAPAAPPREDGPWRTVWLGEDGTETRVLRYQREGRPWACCAWERRGRAVSMRWKPEFRDKLDAWQMIDVLELPHLLLEEGGAILHASYVLWQGRAILFSGPSGIGKSTQAALWGRFRGALTVNGDRALVRAGEDGRFFAHGVCFSGTSGICLDRSAPLAAVVLLAQSGETRARPAGGVEALRALLAQTSYRRENPGDLPHAVDILSRLAASVPVYRLECRPDLSAVETLEDLIL